MAHERLPAGQAGKTTIPAAIVSRVYQHYVAQVDEQLACSSFSNYAEYGVVSLCQRFDLMQKVTPFRARVIETIQERQDPETGHFPTREWECWPIVLAQATGALKLLGARPRHRVPELEHLCSDEEALRKWIEGLNWSHPWGGVTGAGHNMIGLTHAAADLDLIGIAQLDLVRRMLDEYRDDTYGVWHRDHITRPETVHLGGACAMGLVYERFRWPLPNPEGTCRLLGELQLDTGSWLDKWPPGSADMDAVWLLDRYTQRNKKLREEVLPMLVRQAAYITARLANPEDFQSARSQAVVNTLAVLRPIFPDPEDHLPPWQFAMFGNVL